MNQQKPPPQGAIGVTAGDTSAFGFDDQIKRGDDVAAVIASVESPEPAKAD